MTFLQPWLLAFLPLVGLPIIIHLINQRRFQTVHWGAMMFLLAANRMSRGYSRLRRWLIMAMRMLAVAGLLLAVSRPLASGWLGLVGGGQPDVTLLLVDRSPSMGQRDPTTNHSKLERGLQTLSRTFQTLGSGRWVVIEGATRQPRDLDSPEAILNLPNVGPADAPADIPLMLQAAHDYIRDNHAGRTVIWICSDQKANDWTADSARWEALRQAFQRFPQAVRIQLLALSQPAEQNISIRVTEARRRKTADGAELAISLRLTRQGESEEKLTIPVQFEIEGARSVANVELVGQRVDLKEHRIPLDKEHARGWGKVSIPADVNPADDEFYFAYDDPPPRKTVLVVDDPQVERPLRLVAGVSPDPDLPCEVEAVSVEQAASIAWDETALVIWQSNLPDGPTTELLKSFVDRGGQVIFMPPREPSEAEFLGVHWGKWVQGNEPVPIANWRGDEDLLTRTLSGAALPVGQLEVMRYCPPQGELSALATLEGGAPLVGRVATDRGGVYFWATTPAPGDSNLASNGVVLYAFTHRALAYGAAALGKARLIDAGLQPGLQPENWSRLNHSVEEPLSTEYAYQAGVYAAGEDRLLAVNRPAAEDDAPTLQTARVDALFKGLDFARIEEDSGSAQALVREIWRMFLIAMLLALLIEAALCVPKIARPAEVSRPFHPHAMAEPEATPVGGAV